MEFGPNIYRVEGDDALNEAALAIEYGGVIIYPTDTLYGLGVDAMSDSAVKRLYDVKGRDEGKPIHAIVSDMQMIERYAHLDGAARILAERFLPGPLSLILKKREGIETGIAKGIDTFGVRIPDNAFCRELVDKFGGPITTTSANRSGMHPMRSVEAIIEQLGENASHVAVAIDAGELPARAPSTVVDCSGERPVILREGAISSSEIWDALVELED
jgi:L-threonylcarbamoyladenylate synthase